MAGRTMWMVMAWMLLVAVPAGAEGLWGADGAQGNPSNLYRLNPFTGAVLQTVGPIGFAVTGLAVHPQTGELYGSTSRMSPAAPGSLIKIDKTTGAGALIGSFAIPAPDDGQTMADLAFTSDGTLYGWLEPSSDDLYTISLTTGQATKVGESDLGTFGGGLAADSQNTLYLAGEGERGTLHTINRASGAATGVATLDGVGDESIAALDFASSGTLYGVRLITVGSDRGRAFLVTIDTATGHLATLGESVPLLDAIAFDSTVGDPCFPPPATGIVPVAAVLPTMRSVGLPGPVATVGAEATHPIQPATFFAAMIAAGTGQACGCSIAPITTVPAEFLYQTTDPGSNALVGTANTPASIPGGGIQTFLVAFTPTAPFPATDVQLSFKCANTPAAAITPFLNTALLSAEAAEVPDIVALAATLNGDGIVNISGVNGLGFFGVATVNVGSAGAEIIASANTTGPLSTVLSSAGEAVLPLTLTLCRTNPITAQCISPTGPTVTTQIDPGQTPTFTIFVQGAGTVPFDPANNRIFVQFTEGGVLRGATSVAVRTQ